MWRLAGSRPTVSKSVAKITAAEPATPSAEPPRSPAALFRVVSPKRWELLERLQSLGPSSLRGLARSLDRDEKRVHEDVAALIEVGLIEKTEGGRIHVPFEVIEADFELRAA